MDNQTISTLFNDVYNKWWMRWRNADLDAHQEELWNKVMMEVSDLEEKYNHCELVCSMLTSLVMELDRRARRK